MRGVWWRLASVSGMGRLRRCGIMWECCCFLEKICYFLEHLKNLIKSSRLGLVVVDYNSNVPMFHAFKKTKPRATPPAKLA